MVIHHSYYYCSWRSSLHPRRVVEIFDFFKRTLEFLLVVQCDVLNLEASFGCASDVVFCDVNCLRYLLLHPLPTSTVLLHPQRHPSGSNLQAESSLSSLITPIQDHRLSHLLTQNVGLTENLWTGTTFLPLTVRYLACTELKEAAFDVVIMYDLITEFLRKDYGVKKKEVQGLDPIQAMFNVKVKKNSILPLGGFVFQITVEKLW